MYKIYHICCIGLIILKGSMTYAQEHIAQLCSDSAQYLTIYPDIDCLGPWTLVPGASDEFDGSTVDLSKWDYFPGWGHGYTLGSASACPYQDGTDHANGDLAYYTQGNNHLVSNGTLKLYTRQETLSAKFADYDSNHIIKADGLPNYRTWQYTSGSLISKQRYGEGKYEIRCKLPQIEGVWPAFWMYGEHEQEIDILECGNLNYTSSISNDSKLFAMTAHRNVTTPFQSSQQGHNNHCDRQLRYTNSVNLNQDFHIYSVEWDAYQVTFRFDGQPVYVIRSLKNQLGQTVDECNLPVATYIWQKNMLPSPQIPMHVIVNCGVTNFCSPSNPLVRGTFPVITEIDYIRVYQRTPNQQQVHTCTIGRPDDVIINDNSIHNNQTLHIKNSIVTDPLVTIENDADIWWTAGDHMDFNPGFTVNEGGKFFAEIARCEPGLIKQSIANVNHIVTNDLIENFKENTSQSGFDISPNPTNGKIQILSNDVEFERMEVYNYLGQIIHSENSHSTNKFDFNFSASSKGLFFIRLYSKDKSYINKVVVQ